MEAKTKHQKEVMALSKTLKPISKRALNSMKYDVLNSFYYQRYYSIVCSDCAHIWKPKETTEKMKCPHCKRELVRLNFKQPDYNATDYVVFYDYTDDYQIARIVQVSKDFGRGEKATYRFKEVTRNFIHVRKGMLTVVSMLCSFNGYYSNGYNFRGPMELRNYSRKYDFDPYAKSIVPGSRIHPFIYRNGYKDIGDKESEPFSFTRVVHWNWLLGNRTYETLYKKGHMELLSEYVRHYTHTYRRHLSLAVKALLRSDKITDYNLYFDYLIFALKLKYSIHDRKIVLPDNLHDAHQKMMHEYQAWYSERERIRDEERLKRDAEYQAKKEAREKEAYKKKIKMFKSLKIKDKDLTIVPLLYVKDVKAEGEELDHCVYLNEYHKKENELLLSARVNNKRTETIEFSLNDFEVIQARGYSNQFTDHHERILEVMEQNKNHIKSLYNGNRNRELQTAN